MTKTRSLPVLMSSLGASFRCSACGDCCRAAWGINVDEPSYQAIAAALARSPHPGTIGAADAFTPLDNPTRDAHARLRTRPDGACVFLEADNLCYLHRHFGPDIKPVTCRTFPFRPVQRPGGVYAPASVSCRTVRKNLLERPIAGLDATSLVTTDNPELAALAYERYSPGALVLLGRGKKVRVEVLGQIEERMVGLLHERRLPFFSRLLGVRYFLDALIDDPGPGLRPRDVGRCFEQAVGGDFSLLAERAAAFAPSVRLHVGVLFDLLMKIEEPLGQAMPLCARQALHFGFSLGLPQPEHDEVMTCLFGWRFPSSDGSDGGGERWSLLASYCSERLRASNVTTRHGLSGTVQALIYGAALVRFLACGRAGEHGRAVEREDLVGAIAEVDHGLFHNLRVLGMFSEQAPAPARSVAFAEQLCLLPPAPPQAAAGPEFQDQAG